MGYLKETVRGISWMGVLRIFVRGFGFIRIAFLARLLSPSQFGLFGIAALVLSFLEIATETGINVLFIQMKEDFRNFIDSAWTVSIIRGILISLLIILSTPLIMRIFNETNVGPLLYWISLVPFIRGFINPSIIKFQKDLMFKKEFILRTCLYIFEAVVVICFAMVTRSTLSLVFGLILASIFEVIISFAFIKPKPKFVFEIMKFKKIINSGKWVAGYGLFDYLFQNIDDAIVGKFLGIGELGLYQVAYKISSLPVSEVADVFSKVTFPIFSKFESDKKRLKKAFFKTLGVSGILMITFGTLIFLFPKYIVITVLGPEWLDAIYILKILAIYGVLKGITGIIQTLFLSIGKQEYITSITFVTLLGLLTTIWPLVNRFGLIGAGLSAVIGSILGIIFSIYFILKYITNDKE